MGKPNGYNVLATVAGVDMARNCETFAEVQQVVAKLCNAGLAVMVEPYWNVAK